MKKIWIIMIALFLCNATKTVFAQQNNIAEVLETQRKAWNQGDIKAFMQTYWKSDSLVFMGKNGPDYGWQKTYDRYLKSYPDKKAMGILSFEILQIKMLGKNDAHVIGAWHLKRENDNPQGYFTLLLHRFKEGWKIVVDHTQ